jgi:hypothetical protein
MVISSEGSERSQEVKAGAAAACHASEARRRELAPDEQWTFQLENTFFSD